MSKQSYDWLLVDCHHITEVAVAYFPNYSHNSSAVKAFRRSLGEHESLMKDLVEAGYTGKTLHLVPVQLAAIVRHWGPPDEVREMLKKHPHLSVPRLNRKI